MQTNEVDFNGLVVRMKRLERQNRFWKIAGATVLLILGVSLTANVTAQQKGQDVPMRVTTVEAQQFLLRDAAGNLMGELAVKDGKPMLELYDVTGKVRWSTNARMTLDGD
jgi:hypothetical protein